MSKKYDDFIAALLKLCKEHSVQIPYSPILKTALLKWQEQIKWTDEFSSPTSKKPSKLTILKKLDEKLLDLMMFCEDYEIPIRITSVGNIQGDKSLQVSIDHQEIFRDQS